MDFFSRPLLTVTLRAGEEQVLFLIEQGLDNGSSDDQKGSAGGVDETINPEVASKDNQTVNEVMEPSSCDALNADAAGIHSLSMQEDAKGSSQAADLDICKSSGTVRGKGRVEPKHFVASDKSVSRIDTCDDAKNNEIAAASTQGFHTDSLVSNDSHREVPLEPAGSGANSVDVQEADKESTARIRKTKRDKQSVLVGTSSSAECAATTSASSYMEQLSRPAMKALFDFEFMLVNSISDSQRCWVQRFSEMCICSHRNVSVYSIRW